MEDVERHVRRGRPAGPPGEGPEGGLGLGEPGEGRDPRGMGDPRVEGVGQGQVRLAAAPGLLQPGRLLEGQLPVGIGGVPGLEARVPGRDLLRPPLHRRVLVVEAGEDAGGEEAVEGLLGALVGVADEVGQGLEHAEEELPVDGDDQLLVDAAGIVAPGHVGEVQGARAARLQGHEARLGQVEPAREQRHRPQLAVGEVAGAGRHLERHGSDPSRGPEGEAHVGASPGRGAEGLGLAGETELGGEALLGLGVEDLEHDLARERGVRGVVHDHLQLGLVALAEEAREVGPDHELLDGTHLAPERAALRSRVTAWTQTFHEVTESGTVNSMVADAVPVEEQVRLPEGRLGEVGAEGRRLLGWLPRPPRSRPSTSASPRFGSAAAFSASEAGAGGAAATMSMPMRPAEHPTARDLKASRRPESTDPVAGVLLDPVADQRRRRRNRGEVTVLPPGRSHLPEVGADLPDAGPVRQQARATEAGLWGAKTSRLRSYM